MLKKILSLFKKNRHEEKKDLNTSFINDLEELLKIQCPKIESFPYIFDSFDPDLGGNSFFALSDVNPEDIPEEFSYHPAYYNDQQDTIYISEKFRDPDYIAMKIRYTRLMGAERLFFLAHELRHVWQKKYFYDVYYKKNAINFDALTDIAEIDADAFAFSYFFSDRTPFTFSHIPTITDEIALQATLDGGKRWKRVDELSKEYGFTNRDKLEDFKKNIDQDKVNLMIKLLKLQGKI